MEWSLPRLLGDLHHEIEQKLARSRGSLGHPGTMGDASEGIWIELLNMYLPKRYQAAKAHVADSQNQFSQQMDVVIFDRQYSPPILEFQNQTIVAAESVYAAFEAKQTINAALVKYAKEKIASVRRLHRTTIPIPTADGTKPAKELTHIIGGFLSFESEWNPGLGDSLLTALQTDDPKERIDIGCVAAHGTFGCDEAVCYTITPGGKPATAFLLELIARLQALGTVAMMDARAYATWLK